VPHTVTALIFPVSLIRKFTCSAQGNGDIFRQAINPRR